MAYLGENDEEIKVYIFHCYRSSYYNRMIESCTSALKQFPDDVTYKILTSVAYIRLAWYEKCVNLLESISAEADVQLAYLVACIYCKQLLNVDQSDDSNNALNTRMHQLYKHATSQDLYHTALILLSFNKNDKAIEYLQKSISLDSTNIRSYNLRAWSILLIQHNILKAMEIFNMVLTIYNKNLDASLGLIECYVNNGSHSQARAISNKVIAQFPNITLPLIHKMKVYFNQREWNNVIEIFPRIISIYVDDLDAHFTGVVVALVQGDDQYDEVFDIERFWNLLKKHELNNVHLMVYVARLIRKISTNNTKIFSFVIKDLDRLGQMNSGKGDLLLEIGWQYLNLGILVDAVKYFDLLLAKDNMCIEAKVGRLHCEYIEYGSTSGIKDELNTIISMDESGQITELLFLRACLEMDSGNSVSSLNTLMQTVLVLLNKVPYSFRYLDILHPKLFLQVLQKFLDKLPEWKTQLQNIPNLRKILSLLVSACPGVHSILLVVGKLYQHLGEMNKACETMELLTKCNKAPLEAYLLLAEIRFERGHYEKCSQSLEDGLSRDLQLQNNPMYHYIQGLVERKRGLKSESLKSLNTALNLLDEKSERCQRAKIMLQLIDLNYDINQRDEADRLFLDALETFEGTPEYGHFLLLHADHEAKENNVQNAIDFLEQITTDDSLYTEAKTKIAHILLEHRKDEQAFIDCYKDLVKGQSTCENLMLLGDAYLHINDVPNALHTFNAALKLNTTDANLNIRMGQALVRNEAYEEAIEFYRDAIQNIAEIDLKIQLAEIYVKLGRYRDAEDLLNAELHEISSKETPDVEELRNNTKVLNMLATVYIRGAKLSEAIKILKEAYELQTRVRKRCIMENDDLLADEVQRQMHIGEKLADVYTGLSDRDGAIKILEESLKVCPDHPSVSLKLAELHMMMNNLDLCQLTCSSVLTAHPDNEQALVMMADISFRKVDFDMALFHFKQLATKQPTNWIVLVRLAEVMKRNACLPEFANYLMQAQKAPGNISSEPGFIYCNALYQWYSGNLNDALRGFNAIRQNNEWGVDALYNMVDICLNPNEDLTGISFGDLGESMSDDRNMAIHTAARLLKELKLILPATESDFRWRLLCAFRYLATQERSEIERSIEEFTALATNFPDHPGPILGLATAHTYLKQSQRAKNHLKRVAKSHWLFNEAEYLEKCWLLLAEYHIQASKIDQATELLFKVLYYNKSCVRSYELLGTIAEKEQRFKDASNHYEKAWTLCGKSKPTIGYKLAHCYVKCKRYPYAIDVARIVLKLNPDHPKVKKEILEKAINNLRM